MIVIFLVTLFLGVSLISLSAAADHVGGDIQVENRNTQEFGWVQTSMVLLGLIILLTSWIVGLNIAASSISDEMIAKLRART